MTGDHGSIPDDANRAGHSADEPRDDENLQRDIAAMLRQASLDADKSVRMPAEVEARIHQAFGSEMRRSAGASRVVHEGGGHEEPGRIVVPLPTSKPVPSAPEPVSSSTARSPLASDSPTLQKMSSRGSSLTERRQRSRRISRAALALGAAAAIAIGALGVWQETKRPNSGSAVAPSSATSPEVRVTNSQTAYWPKTFTAQAASLTSSHHPRITSTEQAKNQHLTDLSTKQGVERCVREIGGDLAENPDKVYADFGTYRGRPAVVVLIVKDQTTTAWVVNRTCDRKSDVQAGPESIPTRA